MQSPHPPKPAIFVGFPWIPASLEGVLCPVCEHPLEETSAACSGCGFSLSLADAHYGTCLQAVPQVTDHARHISRTGRSSLIKATLEFEQRFPSLQCTTLIHDVPSGVPRRPYLFWLFNRCGLHSALQKGGTNRHVMLWISPETRLLSAIIGYGLEPLVSDRVLNDALAAAAPHVTSGHWAQAGIAFVHALDHGLVVLQSNLPTTFGWFPEGTWTALEDDLHPLEADRSSGALVY
jgi:hypothetical protein